jgi:integrase/recombinase XerD
MRKFVRERTPENIASTRKPSRYTVRDALEAFVLAKEAEGVRPRTVEHYRLYLGYLRDFLGNRITYVDELTPTMIREYVHYLRFERMPYNRAKQRPTVTNRQGLSVNTVNMQLRTFKTMCRWWLAEGMTKSNAMANIKQVRDDQAEEVPGLTDDELALIYKALNERNFGDYRDKVLITLLLDTGLRIGEAATIATKQIDFGDRMLTVEAQNSKTRKHRVVPVSREVLNKLRQLHEECVEYFGEHEEIFYTAWAGPLRAETFRKRLQRLRERTGIKRLHPHMFRHTFARNYILEGGDLFTLQKILDHGDITTTRKYVQMEHKHIKAQHDKFSPVRKWLRK